MAAPKEMHLAASQQPRSHARHPSKLGWPRRRRSLATGASPCLSTPRRGVHTAAPNTPSIKPLRLTPQTRYIYMRMHTGTRKFEKARFLKATRPERRPSPSKNAYCYVTFYRYRYHEYASRRALALVTNHQSAPVAHPRRCSLSFRAPGARAPSFVHVYTYMHMYTYTHTCTRRLRA